MTYAYSHIHHTDLYTYTYIYIYIYSKFERLLRGNNVVITGEITSRQIIGWHRGWRQGCHCDDFMTQVSRYSCIYIYIYSKFERLLRGNNVVITGEITSRQIIGWRRGWRQGCHCDDFMTQVSRYSCIQDYLHTHTHRSICICFTQKLF